MPTEEPTKSVYDQISESIQTNLDAAIESIDNLKEMVQQHTTEINELLDQLIDKEPKE